MEISIRSAMPDDARTLASLNYTVHQLHVSQQPKRYKSLMYDDVFVIAFFEKHIVFEGAYIFISQVDNKDVVYLLGLVRDMPENPFIRTFRDFHIDQISVEPDYQRRGIRTLLLQHGLLKAKEVNADVISLGVAAFNKQGVQFYQKHGFEARATQMWRHLK
jgi:ribosomal protein S18 acetylase RimI-like enzyme